MSIGNATLVITDLQDRPLTHWSLPALQRANPGDWPAIYHPDSDGTGGDGETLELTEDEAEMVAAIEKLRNAIDKRRPRPGRLRWLLMGASIASVLAVGVFWLPGALVDHAVSVLPSAKRHAIGTALLAQVERVSGGRCDGPANNAPLTRLTERLSAVVPEDMSLAVVPDGLPQTVMLPGQIMLLNSRLLEDFEEPDVAAGFILAAALRAETQDPLRHLLERAGMLSTLRLMATGDLDQPALRTHAEALLAAPLQTGPQAGAQTNAPAPSDAELLQAFRAAEVKSAAYAYALDVSGETTLNLIEADPYPQAAPRPVLSDADWLRLQAICEG